jgi:murein DD-endopeptidase MepM/ murein hydrolase activator NlpD
MLRPNVPSCSRAWPRVTVLAFVGVLAAGCSDSARFAGPFDSHQPPADVTGSIATREPVSRVSSRPLPPPPRPYPVIATGGFADGAHGLGAYRPGERRSDITGSVSTRHSPPVPAGHWSWDGGSPVTVGRGQSLEAIARKYGVPLSAIMQVNGIRNATAIRQGQRVVIPRYVSASAPRREPRVAAVAPARPHVGDDVHIVVPGETLIAIARRHHVSLTALARANNIDPYTTRLIVGQHLTIPGSEHKLSESRAPAPRLERPHPAAPRTVASVPTQNVRMAKAEVPVHAGVTKTAEPAGAMPTFRWPVHGRIIAGFGTQPNGTQNDGINLAVPEGTPIKAVDDGVVAYAGNELKGYGNLVLIRHANGYVSAYADASALLVKRGDVVKRGQVIARAGQTGNVNSPQLHFEIRKGSVPVDPTKYLGGA